MNKQRRNWVIGAIISVLVVAAGAAATGWILSYVGVSGSSHGSFATGTVGTALTVADNVASPTTGALSPGATLNLNVQVANNDPAAAHKILTATAAITSTPTDCASHLTAVFPSLDGSGNGFVGLQVAPGALDQAHGFFTVTADSSLPSDCSAGTFTVAITGTST